MQNVQDSPVKGTTNRLPPAQIVRRLFEQQQSEIDALRARITTLESTIKRVAIAALFGLVLLPLWLFINR